MFFSKYNKIIRKIFTFAIAISVPLFFACGAGDGDDSDRYETSRASALSSSEFNSFRSNHSAYFEDDNYTNMIQKVISGSTLPSNGTTYYISPTGDDDKNDGTQQKPFKTFSKALEEMFAGDTLIVMDGTYMASTEDARDEDSDNAVELSKSGNASAFITIKAQHRGEAVISGFTNAQKSDYALMYINGSYIMIDGLVFSNLEVKNGGKGIELENGAHHVTVANCEFTKIKTASHVTKESKYNEDLQYTANAIIAYADSNSKPITNILIYNNSCYDMETGWGECISLTENCQYISIIENYIDSTENIGIDVGGNYVTDLAADKRFTRYAYIAHNTVINESTADTYGDTCYGIYSDGGQHIQIIGNKVANCMGGIEAGAEEVNEGYPTADITISGNEIIDCKEKYFSCGGWKTDLGWVKNVVFTGNTCTANTKGDCMVNLSKCDNVEIKENTFRKSGNFEIDTFNLEFEGWGIEPTVNNKKYKGTSTSLKAISDSIERDNTWIGF